jgi:hypothetical protein
MQAAIPHLLSRLDFRMYYQTEVHRVRAAQFVEELSRKMGLVSGEAALVDRYLAQAGMRSKASGREYPNITATEAVRIPLALMCARTPARSVQDLRDVERFRMMSHGITVENGSIDNLKAVIGFSESEIENMDLIDVLAAVALYVATPWRSAPRAMVWVEVNLGGAVTLQVKGGGFKGEITFIGVMDPGHSMEFSRSSRLGPKIFAWIGHIAKEAAEA